MWIVLVTLIVIALLIAALYNGLVALRTRADSAWSDIDVQLQRRHDLIPNLVETVKGYATHERGALEAVTAARTRAVAARSEGPAARAEVEAGLGRALGGLFAVAEAYPELRATENFQQLQGSLAAVEDAVQNARRYYNAVVRDLNTRVHQVPTNLIASTFGFETREFFEPADAAAVREVPSVKFEV
jgi:LemA protein